MKIISTPNSEKSEGHFSPAILSNGCLYISGQCGDDPITGVRPDGIQAQTENCLKNLDLILNLVGATKESVVMCRVFTADNSYWGVVNESFKSYFGAHKPARIVIPSKDLAPGLLVEIEAVAEIEIR